MNCRKRTGDTRKNISNKNNGLKNERKAFVLLKKCRQSAIHVGSSFQPDGHGTIVMDLHLHMHAELTSLSLHAMFTQQLSELFHKWSGDFRQRGIDKRGTPSFAG